jgi:FAD dependent oxidoreductase TIGR03364
VAKVVVVGAGIIGAMCARRSLAAGHEVVQLDRELAARGASVRNFGLVWISGRKSGPELELALHARMLWDEVAADVPGVSFRANGSLTILRDEEHLDVAEEVLRLPDAGARHFSILEPEEVRHVNPAIRGDFAAGLHCALDGAVEPRRAADAIRAANLASPLYTWLPGRHVVGFDDRAARDHFGDRHEGDVVLLCPGAAHGIEGWRPDERPLRRVRLQMLETEPFERELTTSIADWDSLRYYPVFDVPARDELAPPPEIVADRHIQLLLQQRLDGGLTIGDTHDYDEPFEVAVDDAPYEHLLRRAESILGVRMPRVRRRWAGVYSQTTNDELFHLEQLADGVYVITGVGGRGMTMSPAFAELALEQSGLKSQDATVTV